MTALLSREATEAEINQLTEINKLAQPFDELYFERDPWKVTLSDGLPVILFLPLKAAVAVEKHGIKIVAASAQDLAENYAKSLERDAEIEEIACKICTRHDTCGNHEQHGVGCHCLYRGPFFYLYHSEGGRSVLCANHCEPAANVVEIEFI